MGKETRSKGKKVGTELSPSLFKKFNQIVAAIGTSKAQVLRDKIQDFVHVRGHYIKGKKK